jgi:hypothetical protein
MKTAENDPVVLLDDKFTEFRIQFWEYFSKAILEKFSEICEQGGFGKIDSFSGCGISRRGSEYVFNWEHGKKLQIQKATVALNPGYIILKGELDFNSINRIRNFPLFHLRDMFKKELAAEWEIDDE